LKNFFASWDCASEVISASWYRIAKLGVHTMASILKLSDATALALHSMVHLALDPEGQSTTAEISEVFKVSRHHLAKVHQRLRKAGFIRSQRGPSGGVSLAKDPAQISLLDIYETMEGSLNCNPCLFDNDVCPRENCMLSNLLPSLALQVRDYFKNTSLEQMARESNWKGVQK
jgi:Rrf2 family protein